MENFHTHNMKKNRKQNKQENDHYKNNIDGSMAIHRHFCSMLLIIVHFIYGKIDNILFCIEKKNVSQQHNDNPDFQAKSFGNDLPSAMTINKKNLNQNGDRDTQKRTYYEREMSWT